MACMKMPWFSRLEPAIVSAKGPLFKSNLERVWSCTSRRNVGVSFSSSPLILTSSSSGGDARVCSKSSEQNKFTALYSHGNIGFQSSGKRTWRRYSSTATRNRFTNILVVPKKTRYQFEKQRFGENKTEDEMRKRLAERGSDLDVIRDRHKAHAENTERCQKVLRELELNTRVIPRSELNEDTVAWADLIISMGGDGTYLLAASKVLDQTPVIGVNTDPKGSEGHLCLPNRYTRRFDEAMKRILAGDFRWKKRQRIRVTIDGCLVNKDPIDLHELELSFPEHYHTHLQRETRLRQGLDDMIRGPRVLPVRALNEIFVGESLSSRMSYYEMAVDDGPMEKQKSSGVTVSTGTGSTSWSFNINKLSNQSVKDILQITTEETGCSTAVDDSSVERIAERFNSSLVFDGGDPRMAYTVRDPVTNSVYQSGMPRGFARKIVMRSRCWDAALVIDAGSSFIFNDGAIATMEINEEDALNTVELVD